MAAKVTIKAMGYTVFFYTLYNEDKTKYSINNLIVVFTLQHSYMGKHKAALKWNDSLFVSDLYCTYGHISMASKHRLYHN